jgi:hypothetical protein
MDLICSVVFYKNTIVEDKIVLACLCTVLLHLKFLT